MRPILVALLLVLALVALPACRMNERMSGTAFGAGGGLLIGALAGGVGGAVVGTVAGGVTGYLVGDYLADKRERCMTPCDPCAPPCPQPCPTPCDPSAPGGYAPAYAPSYPPRVGGLKTRGIDVSASRQAVEAGRRARTSVEARAAYERALRLDPRNADAWNALGLVQLAGGEPRVAERSFRRALGIRPDHYAARQNLALAAGRP